MLFRLRGSLNLHVRDRRCQNWKRVCKIKVYVVLLFIIYMRLG